MKAMYKCLAVSVALVMSIIFLPGCLKDKVTRTYTKYTPVYKTTAEVRANIKSDIARDILKPGKLFIRGQYIYLNEIDKGIHVIDNSNPSSPKNVAFINIPGNMDMAVKGNTLYADLYTDLVTLDITDPLRVQTKSILNSAFPFRRYSNGFVPDNTKVIVDWLKKDTTVTADLTGSSRQPEILWLRREIMMFDMASSATANKAASPFGMGGSMARFSIVNANLYTVSDADLSVYSIAAPEKPVFSNKVNMGWGIETIYPFKDKLFIGSTSAMFIYDITNPDKPSKVGQFNHLRACDPVIADDNHAYVTLRNGSTCSRGSNQLDILNISNLTAPSLAKTYPMTNPHGLSKDGKTLFICDGKDGLKIYDASSVNDLKLLLHIKGFESYDVITNNNIAIVVSKDGLRQYDYSDLNDIKLLSKIGWEQ